MLITLMGLSINSLAVLNIIQTNTNTPTSTSGPIISGFAKNLPLKTVLMIVVPPYWSISATDEVLKKTVSWSGGTDWVSSLNTIADEYNLLVTRDAKTKSIKIIEIKTSPSFITTPTPITTPAPVATPTPITTPAPVVLRTPITTTTPAVPTIKPACVTGCNKPIVIEKYNQLTKLQTIFGKLLTDFNFIFEDLIVSKSIQDTSNTVRFDFSFNGMKKDASVRYKNFSSFFVFTKKSVYAPMFASFEIPVILDWYATHFTHPSANIPKPVLIKDLVLLDSATEKVSTITNNIIKKELNVSKKLPSFLHNRYYTAKTGEMLSAVLSDWSESNDVTVIWNATNDFKIFKEIKMFGNLLASTNTIIKFYNNTSNPLQTRFFTKNKTFLVEDLAIIHRSK
jgi:hypothetical protein